MKKIMVMVVAAAMALAANATSVMWSASNVYQGWEGGTASAKAGGVVGYLFFANEISAADLTAALTGAEDAKYTMAEALAKGYTATTSTSAGKFLASSTPDTIADSYKGTSVSAYAVIFNAGDVDDATYFYQTSAVTMTVPSTGDPTFAFGSQATASAQTGSWTAVVPEPTSGLLMLVGLAGLALRRRRA